MYVCMYVCMYIGASEVLPERPESLKEAQRASERHRDELRDPERPRDSYVHTQPELFS